MNQKTLCSMLLLLLPLCTLCSQEAYMGQIQVTRRSFSLSGNQLHIQMDVNYEGLQMPSDESLTLTPRCEADDQPSACPLFLLMAPRSRKCMSVLVCWVAIPVGTMEISPLLRWF